jgi:glycosyltransferase involved in cell wall biosynthesis
MKIVYISPHLSTGGLPQYLFKKIESLNLLFEIYCIEHKFLGDAYVVQRNKIKNLLGDRFYSASGKPDEYLIELIRDINPDVVHFEEFPETFLGNEICAKIYSSDRNYLIFETGHGIYFDPQNKKFIPDKFIFVSEYQSKLYGSLGAPFEIVEYPIELKKPQKKIAQEALGFDPNKKHVINVGLFTQGKNQKELVELARKLPDLQFHFIGNLAINFKDYWEPITKDLPSNCKIWAERSDVDLFYQAADLMVFTSKKECSPLVIREAIGWRLKTLIYNLNSYCDMYDKYANIEYLKDGDEQYNIDLIKSCV